MKNSKLLLSFLTTLLSVSAAHASTSYVMRAASNVNFTDWVSIDPTYGLWADSGDVYDCSSYSPSPSISITSNYVQSSDCSQDQVRTVQEKKYDNISGETKIINSYTDTQTVSEEIYRDVDVSNSSWNSDIISCGDYSPNRETIRNGKSFTQSRDCITEKTRTWTHTEQDENTVIGEFFESETVDVTQNQTTTGTREYNWVLCASENGKCNFNDSEDRYVRYGEDGSYVIKWKSDGVSCSNSVFGDPIRGTAKSCWYDE